MRHVACIILSGMLLLLSGCKMNTRMTTDEFYEFCNDEFAHSEDCDSQSICSSYRDILSVPYADAKTCAAECNKLDSREWMANVMTDCSATVGDATDWCEQFCRRNYK